MWLSRYRAATVAAGVVALSALATPAMACGGLVAPNGAVRLDHTVTLAAYHDGIEHYVTSFTYEGGGTAFGSITPLPGVPLSVIRGGSWTLQRLEREVAPPLTALNDVAAAAPTSEAAVLLQTTVDALDITVLRGGSAEVLAWVRAHGFAVSKDAPAVLDFYAKRSPIFMVSRFNPARARARGQLVGDATPVQVAIRTPHPWVPLRILALAKDADDVVTADVFLLTDHQPNLLTGRGVTLTRSEPASANLLRDLGTDRNMGWMPRSGMWLSFLRVNTPAGSLRYDLAIDQNGTAAPSPVAAGLAPGNQAGPALDLPSPPLIGEAVALLVFSLLVVTGSIVAWRTGRRSAGRL